MIRTCNQLGHCKRAEISPCIAECEFSRIADQVAQSKTEQVITTIAWLVIILTSIAMVGVVASAVYGFGYDFLTRIG